MPQIAATLYGWISSKWQKQPMTIGYSATGSAQGIELNAAAGTVYLGSGNVPAGEIWTVQTIGAKNTNTDPSRIVLYANTASLACRFYQETTPGANVWVLWYGSITLGPGDSIYAVFHGCTLNDDLNVRVGYVRTDIDQ